MFTGIGIGASFPRNQGGFSPSQLGTVLSWVDGDHASNSLDTEVIYDDLNDIGTLGGTWDAATDAQPVAVQVDGRSAPIFRGTRRAQSSAAASSWAFLHDGSGDGTLTIRFYVYAVTGGSQWIFSTTDGTPSNPGITVFGHSSGIFRVRISDGTVNTNVNSTVSVSTGWHTLQYTKNGLDVGLSVDAEAPVTATIPNSTAAVAHQSPYLGAFSSGTFSAESLVAECVIHGAELDATGLSQMRTYMSNRWNATPDFVPSELGEVLSWVMGDLESNALDAEVIYDDLNDIGTLGGTWDAKTNAQPVAVTMGGRAAPVFRGSRRIDSSLAASAWGFLSDSTSSATITLPMHLYDAGDGGRPFLTKNGAAASIVGLQLQVVASSIRARWADGSVNTDIASTVTLSADTLHIVQITKNGTSVGLLVDGETVVTGTIPGTATAPSVPGRLGADSANSINGIVPEMVIHGVELDAAGLAQMRTYMADRWNATPDFSWHKYGNVIAHFYSGAGVTIDTGVSALRDLSGHNNDLAQATTGDQPALESSWRNGEALIRGDGSGDHLERSSFTTGTLSQVGTIVQAGEWSSASVAGQSPGSIDGGVTGATSRWITRELSANNEVALYAGASGESGLSAVRDSPYIRRDVVNAASSSVLLRQDGVSDQSSSTWSVNPGTGNMVGATLLGSPTGANSTDGGLSELAIFDSDISANDTEYMDAMSTKYDIEAV